MRSFINKHPLFQLSVLILTTSVLQYPNPITREPALLMIKSLLTDCQSDEGSWVCQQEAQLDKREYYGWLIYGSVVKVVLTILTSGAQSTKFFIPIQVPSRLLTYLQFPLA
jgi:chloride channel 3/4/5